MATPKSEFVRRTVTIPRELDEKAHRLVAEREFSALVTAGLSREIHLRLVGEFLAEYEAKHGTIPAEALAAAVRQEYKGHDHTDRRSPHER